MWVLQIRSALLALLIHTVTVNSIPGPPDPKLVSFADAFSGNFSVSRTSLQWTTQGVDGSYVTTDPATTDLLIANIVTGTSATFVKAGDIAEVAREYYDYAIQPSGKHVLFWTNYTKRYRYTFVADYYVFDVAAKTTVPLWDGQKGDIQYAGWAPTGDKIAFVVENDLYIWQNGSSTRITRDGGPDVFNAVPDWVYEEEIFGDTKTLWWSPDGEYVAFMRIDETGVPTFQIPYYMAGKTIAPPYPEYLQLRYPKVGETNPTVTFHLLSIADLASGPSKVELTSFAPDNLIVGEVAWVTEAHSKLIIRTLNRVQDQEQLLLVDTETSAASVVRKRDATPGWIDIQFAINFVSTELGYVDISDESGWNHLYLYPVDGSTPTALTTGNWEVTALLNVDAKNKKVYYQSTQRDSTERHVYSVSLDGSVKTALVDDTLPGSWTASFSAGGGYYILSYNGPLLPHQELYSTSDTTKAIRTLNDNAKLAAKLSEYALPKVTWSTIEHPDGYSFNVMERLPPYFDPSRKYPVVFDNYGGPSSQQTAKTFRQVDFRAYLASDPELQYVVLSVDNRGTGFKGRAFRTPVTQQLGTLEAQDQVYAARVWAAKPYIDAEHVAIMGWSYGGYLAAKVVELASDAFSFALITAPVSDWRFYDSFYTERYMKNLTNSDGSDGKAAYLNASVHDAAGFKSIRGGFLIQHGTGDDNVHFQHSAALVDTLTNAGVGPGKLNVQWFTDSDHGIRFHGAQRLVYKQMARYLWLEKERKGGEPVRHQFDKRGRKVRADDGWGVGNGVTDVVREGDEDEVSDGGIGGGTGWRTTGEGSWGVGNGVTSEVGEGEQDEGGIGGTGSGSGRTMGEGSWGVGNGVE